MLDLAVIRRPGLIDGGYDVGRILDAMLYYGRVHLVLDYGGLLSLWRQLGVDDLTALLTHDRVSCEATPEFVAMHNVFDGRMRHMPIYGTMQGNKDNFIKHSDDEGIFLHGLNNQPEIYGEVSRKQVRRVLSLTRRTRYKVLLGDEAKHHWLFKALARDPETLKLFASNWASAHGAQMNESQLQSASIVVHEEGDNLIVDSTVPIQSVISGDEECNWGSILASVHEYGIDLYLAQALSADIVTRPEDEWIAAARIDLSINRARRSRESINAFEEMAFGQAGYLGSAYNEGVLTFAAALREIDKSARFRVWLDGLPPTAELLHEYHRAVTRETVLDRLPGKGTRFTVATAAGFAADALLGAGGLGIVGGLALSAADQFVVDRLVAGWRPNIFIGQLKRRIEAAQR